MNKVLINPIKIIIFLLPFLLSLFNSNYAFAQLDCNITYDPDCSVLTDPTCNPAPKPSQILCPFVRIINVMMIMAGIVFAVMLGWAAIKLGAAWGDPKGLDSAKKTGTYALIGVFVVVGALSIMAILNTTFGINIFGGGGPLGSAGALSNYMSTRLNKFTCEVLNVVDTGTGHCVCTPKCTYVGP